MESKLTHFSDLSVTATEFFETELEKYNQDPHELLQINSLPDKLKYFYEIFKSVRSNDVSKKRSNIPLENVSESNSKIKRARIDDDSQRASSSRLLDCVKIISGQELVKFFTDNVSLDDIVNEINNERAHLVDENSDKTVNGSDHVESERGKTNKMVEILSNEQVEILPEMNSFQFLNQETGLNDGFNLFEGNKFIVFSFFNCQISFPYRFNMKISKFFT